MTNNKISKATLERAARRMFGDALVIEKRDVGFFNVISVYTPDNVRQPLLTVKELSKATARQKMLEALRAYERKNHP